MLSEWSHRVDELIAHPSLAAVLGVDADGIGAAVVDDGADILIPAGFTVLYYTGIMTKADERFLVKTIRRELRDHGSDETLETLQDDLIRFSGGSPPKPRKPKPWLVIDDGWNDPGHAKWLRRIASAIRPIPAGWRGGPGA